MRILQVIQRYPPALGGSETWCADLSRELAAGGDRVKVLTLDILEEEEFWREPPVEACTTRLGKLDWDGPVLVRRFARSLPVFSLYHLFFKAVLDWIAKVYFYGPHSIEMYGRLLAEARRADVVHLHTVPYPHNFVGYLAARLARKRVVITPYFHRGHPHYERRSHYWLLRHADAVIALTAHERDHLAAGRVPASRIAVTGTGLRTDDYVAQDLRGFRARLLHGLDLTERTKLVLFLGRKTEYKGLDLLIEAIRRLRVRHEVALLMAGPSLPWFDRLYASLSDEDRARIVDLGIVPHQDKVNLLHLASVLVLPSAFESFGIVFLEAWACGTPVIGSDAGAIPGVVDRGGLLFRAGDAADLAEKIDEVLADDHRAAALADRGRDQLLSRYRWPAIADVVRRAYRRPARRRLRVLICSNLWPPHVIGGAELVAHAQARALAEAGHEVRVFAGRVSPGSRRHAAVDERGALPTTWIALWPHDLTNATWDPDAPEVRDAFGRVLDAFAPDLVHMHNVVGLAATLVDECRARGVPAVMTLHDYWGICFKNTMVKNDGALCRRAGFDCLDCRETLTLGGRSTSVVERNARVLRSLRAVDRLVAPSRHLADRYVASGVDADAITVLPNGIDTARFAAGPDRGEPLTLGFLGYLGAHKGVAHLLRALAERAVPPDVQLRIVGDGEDRGRLESLARELALGARVTFHGRVPNADVPSMYQRIDALVVPSIWPENSPVTITEAMASSLPVIASDVGGIGELVAHGVTGLLVPPGVARALARAIAELRAAPERRREMGRRGRARIEALDLRLQVARLVEVYREVIAARPRPARHDEAVILYDSSVPGSRTEARLMRQLAVASARTGRHLAPWRLDAADGDVAAGAVVAIVAGESAWVCEHAVRAWLAGVPLLVSEESAEAIALCRASGGGLVYRSDEELQRCLALLLEDAALRARLARNGRRYVDRHSGRAPAPALHVAGAARVPATR